MTLIKDTYQIISSSSEGEYKEKGSKFLAYARPVIDTSDCSTFLDDIHDIHPKARHFCYAYRLGIEGNLFRSNDDGEPSGTAGKPILGQLLSHDVSDTMVIVVRYFGGTKLGASGLINAYKTAADKALNSAIKKDKILSKKYSLTFSYEHMGSILNTVKKSGLEIADKSFDNEPTVHIEIPLSQEKVSLIRLKAQLLGITTDEVTMDTIVPFCTIESLEEL